MKILEFMAGSPILTFLLVVTISSTLVEVSKNISNAFSRPVIRADEKDAVSDRCEQCGKEITDEEERYFCAECGYNACYECVAKHGCVESCEGSSGPEESNRSRTGVKQILSR